MERIDGGLNIDDDTVRMRGGGVGEERQMCTRSSQRDGGADGRRRRCVSGSRAGTEKRKRQSQRDAFLVLTTINGPASLRCSSIAAAPPQPPTLPPHTAATAPRSPVQPSDRFHSRFGTRMFMAILPTAAVTSDDLHPHPR